MGSFQTQIIKNSDTQIRDHETTLKESIAFSEDGVLLHAFHDTSSACRNYAGKRAYLAYARKEKNRLGGVKTSDKPITVFIPLQRNNFINIFAKQGFCDFLSYCVAQLNDFSQNVCKKFLQNVYEKFIELTGNLPAFAT